MRNAGYNPRTAPYTKKGRAGARPFTAIISWFYFFFAAFFLEAFFLAAMVGITSFSRRLAQGVR